MSTRSESAASATAKKGPSKKKTRKLQQRKPKASSPKPSANAARKHTRTKSDAPQVLTAEVAASSSDARARRDEAKRTRVRSSGR